jgi:aminotransferase in exopolysaccharide biosynthesis
MSIIRHDYIPLSVPNLKGNELKYVKEAIETEWVSTAGPFIPKFEQNISSYVNSKGAVSCQNGTSGLHIALKVLKVKQNNEVIVPTLTFIAAVNPVNYIGANPIFMDNDDSLCIDPIKLKQFCEEDCNFVNGKLMNNITKKHIKAIIVVHVFGNMADMEQIMNISKKYNLRVIEDATEALGTYYLKGIYKNKYAGTIGDIGVYSFNGNKIITTGGGGMIVSNNLKLLEHAKHLTTQAKSDALYFKHDEIGYNYRMTNLQAALGIAQLEQIEEFISIKERNFKKYKQLLSNLNNIKLLGFREGIRPNYWFYSLLLNNYDIDSTINFLESKYIQTRPIWDLIHRQDPYIKNQSYLIEKAIYYVNNVINIPCSSNLKEEDVNYIVESIKDI